MGAESQDQPLTPKPPKKRTTIQQDSNNSGDSSSAAGGASPQHRQLTKLLQKILEKVKALPIEVQSDPNDASGMEMAAKKSSSSTASTPKMLPAGAGNSFAAGDEEQTASRSSNKSAPTLLSLVEEAIQVLNSSGAGEDAPAQTPGRAGSILGPGTVSGQQQAPSFETNVSFASTSAASPHNKSSASGTSGGGTSSGATPRRTVADTWRTKNRTGKSQAPAEVVSFGQCIGAATYFILESLLVRTNSGRISLFMKATNGFDLQHVASAGVGMLPAKIGTPNSTGLVQTVYSTGIAANLNIVNLEDVADCPGPGKAKNALMFPVRSQRDPTITIGVVCLVNKAKGTEPYSANDERIVHFTASSLSYVYEQYHTDPQSCVFDPAPLHRLKPLPTFTAPSVGLPTEYAITPLTQKVYHRNGAEKFIRREVLEEESTQLKDEGVASNLKSVEEYITMVEQCWRQSIVDGMETERQLKMKQSHISDAREILSRKQRKLDLLKDALCEQLAKSPEGMAASSRRRSVRKR